MAAEFTNLLEMLSTFAKRIEEYAEAVQHKDLIVSSDLNVSKLHEDHGITKTPVVWPLYDYRMFYIVEVPPGTEIAKHVHPEAVFRVLISGSLTLNGRKITVPGTWFVVNKKVPYQVSTETGYTALVGYTSVCTSARNSKSASGDSPPRA